MVQSGHDATNTEFADGLESLNDMILSWSSLEGMQFEPEREEFAVIAGVKKYTIGLGQTFNSTRPRKVLNAILLRNNISYALRIIRHREMDSIANGNVIALPSRIYYRQEYPHGTLELDYEPDQNYTLLLTALKELPQFPDLTTEIAYPGEYVRALKAALAVEIASEYGMEASNSIVSIGRSALENIMAQSSKIQPLRTPPGLSKSSRYNIYADE